MKLFGKAFKSRLVQALLALGNLYKLREPASGPTRHLWWKQLNMAQRRCPKAGAEPQPRSLVCKVENTMCPVIAACTASSAVSLSRISPIIIMFGSCLSKAREPNIKSQTDFGVNLHLVGADNPVFHRIFNGGNVHRFWC